MIRAYREGIAYGTPNFKEKDTKAYMIEVIIESQTLQMLYIINILLSYILHYLSSFIVNH